MKCGLCERDADWTMRLGWTYDRGGRGTPKLVVGLCSEHLNPSAETRCVATDCEAPADHGIRVPRARMGRSPVSAIPFCSRHSELALSLEPLLSLDVA